MGVDTWRVKAWIMGVGVIFLIGAFFFLHSVRVSITGAEEAGVLPAVAGVDLEKTTKINKNGTFTGSSLQKNSFGQLFEPVVRPLEPLVSYVTGVFSDRNVVETGFHNWTLPAISTTFLAAVS